MKPSAFMKSFVFALATVSVACASSPEAERSEAVCGADDGAGDGAGDVGDDAATDAAIDQQTDEAAADTSALDTAPPDAPAPPDASPICSEVVPPRDLGFCDLVIRVDQKTLALVGWRELCEERAWTETWPLESMALVAQAFTHRAAPLATNVTVRATTLFSQGPADDDDFALIDGDLGAFLVGASGPSLTWSDWRPPFPEGACKPEGGVGVLVREIVRPGATPTEMSTIVAIGNGALDNPLGALRHRDDSRCGPRLQDVEVFRWGTREWIVVTHPGAQCFGSD